MISAPVLDGTTGAGVEHHEHGVEALLVGGDLLADDGRELVVDHRPEVDHLVVTLVVGDEAHGVVHLDALDILVALLDEAVLLRRNEDVAQVEGDAGAEGLVVTEVLDVVQELGGTGDARGLDDRGTGRYG